MAVQAAHQYLNQPSAGYQQASAMALLMRRREEMRSAEAFSKSL